MGLQGYVGSAADAARVAAGEARRAAERAAAADAKRAIEAKHATGLREFGAGASEAVEAAFKTETVGLVTRDQYLARRSELEKELGAAGDAARAAAAAAASRAAAEAARAKARAAARAKLSFDDGDEEEEGDDDGGGGPDQPGPSTTKAAAGPVGKDPAARTDFLPDAAREAEEAALRAALRAEFDARRAAARDAPLEIVYSYWDGAGHRRSLTVRAGDTVSAFLGSARAQLVAEGFKELRGIGSDGLMYVKEDVILPGDVTFHDLIARRARGKSGPLFQFDVHDDVRAAADARKETDESHAGKVVLRSWYARNKHIFPASRWEAYDPARVYARYTVKGGEVHTGGK